MLQGKIILLSGFLLSIFSVIHFSFPNKKNDFVFYKNQTQNHAPVVKIVSPKTNVDYRENAQIAYKINVSDKEDGESKYQEINPKEVLLEIEYVKDTSDALLRIHEGGGKDAPGLALIKSSNCLNCHSFKSKLIGPSFFDITQRYHQFAKVEDTLVNHVLNGSKGRWGNVQMPSNSKLNRAEAQEVVDWIFKNANNPSVNYLVGTEGTFRLTPPGASAKNVILIATYTDHGTKDNPALQLKGQDIAIIQIN